MFISGRRNLSSSLDILFVQVEGLFFALPGGAAVADQPVLSVLLSAYPFQ
jgi:hypothetical protein